MALQNISTTETAYKDPFLKKLEDLPGGITVAVADLVQTEVKAGTPVGLDAGTGLYHVVKTAEAQDAAADSATDYKVEKGHNFAVGQFFSLGTGKKAYAITAITTTNASYDTITLGTTLGEAVTKGDIFIEAAEENTGTGSTLLYTPSGLVGTRFDVVATGNHLTDCIVRGSVIESLLPPIHANIKTALSLIRFV